jgi:putative ABC transport system permease protein
VVALESLRIALQSLWANPLRSFLTLIGIAVGIAAVLHVVGLGTVTQRSRTAESVDTLSADDARQLLAESQVISVVVPTYSGQGNAEFQGVNWQTRITGTTPEHLEVNNDALSAGRFFTEREVAQRSRVAVLGDTVRAELFGGRDPVGADIRINSQRFAVIGALEPKGESYMNPDDQIFVPLTTAQQRLFGMDSLSSILAGMRDSADFEEALFDIETILRRRHRLRADQENDFQVRRQDFFLAAIQDTNREIARFVLVIAGVSLLVGGLGIANVMLVSITERTREIGIRRALGANRLHILVQFLTEAMVLGIAGGLLGVAGGASFNRLQIGTDAPISWEWVGYSFAICAGIGVLAGAYPATRAAWANVLDALRYE